MELDKMALPGEVENAVSTELKQVSLQQNDTALKLMSPNVQLQGHQGDIFSTKFSHCGNFLASAGHDRLILIWDVFDPKVKNLGYCKGHKNAILDL